MKTPLPAKNPAAANAAPAHSGRKWWGFGVLMSLIALLFALFSFGFSIDWTKNPSPLVGVNAPRFSLTDLKTNAPFNHARFADRPYVLNFWASWCIPCRQEASVLERAHQRYSVNGKQIYVLGIAVQTQKAQALAFAKQFGKTYPTALDKDDGSNALNYGIYGVPETFFISADGTVKAKQIGPLTDEILTRQIESLLAIAPPKGNTPR